MSKHNFISAVHHKTINKAIKADTIFSKDLKSIITKEYLDGRPNEIGIEFNSNITNSEALRLDTLISSLPTADIDILLDKNMEKISKFSEKLIREYGKKNIKRGYTSAQVKQLVADLKPISDLLHGKALPTALEELLAFTVTNEITQGDIDEFVSKITNFLSGL